MIQVIKQLYKSSHNIVTTRALSTAVIFMIIFLITAMSQSRVARWAPVGISSPQFESHPAFDPLSGDFYFVRSTPSFTGWQILLSRKVAGRWLAPVAPPFAAALAGDHDAVEADPFFSADGMSLYFISTRNTDGVRKADLDIWRVDRNAKLEWGKPVRLPAPVNSDAKEWFPRISIDGWLYFGSGRAGGFGKTDIWRARQDTTGQWQIENAGPSINTAGDEFEALPSPDGKRLIIMTDKGLYESRWTGKEWSPRQKLPPEVNVNGSEVGPLFSPSGKSLLFARDTKSSLSGEFFVWYENGIEDWPPPIQIVKTDKEQGTTMKLSTYLLFDGDCKSAMAFYHSTFGGELTLTTVGDSPMKRIFPAAMHARALNARLKSNIVDISASDWLQSSGTLIKGNNNSLYLSGGTPDETRLLFQKLSTNATVTDALSEQPFGLYGALNDQFGVRWRFHAEKQ